MQKSKVRSWVAAEDMCRQYRIDSTDTAAAAVGGLAALQEQREEKRTETEGSAKRKLPEKLTKHRTVCD